MISGFEILLILLIILIIGILLSFLGSSFADSAVERIADWCIRKMEGYEKKGVNNFFSVSGVIKTVCSTIVRTFKFIDRIENPKLRTGLKLNAVSIILSITVALISFLVIAVIYVALILIGLYIFYKLIDLWYRHEKGLPLFPDGSSGNPIFKTSKYESNLFDRDKTSLKDEYGSRIGELDSNYFLFDDDKQVIRDENGKVVGELDSNYFLLDDDKQAIKDENGNLIGHIETGWDGIRKIKKY